MATRRRGQVGAEREFIYHARYFLKDEKAKTITKRVIMSTGTPIKKDSKLRYTVVREFT